MALQRKYDPRFEALWGTYPKWPAGRSKKELSAKAFAVVDKVLMFDASDIAAIRADIEQRLKDCETWQHGNKFGPVGMQVYLNQHLWNEPYEKAHRHVRESQKPPQEVWHRMGYASESDYYAGRRMSH